MPVIDPESLSDEDLIARAERVVSPPRVASSYQWAHNFAEPMLRELARRYRIALDALKTAREPVDDGR